MTTNPFTVWISDDNTTWTRDGKENLGYAERPFICHVDAENAEDVVNLALRVYVNSFGYPSDGFLEFAAENGAYVHQVIAGHIPFESIIFEYDGYHGDEPDLVALYDVEPQSAVILAQRNSLLSVLEKMVTRIRNAGITVENRLYWERKNAVDAIDAIKNYERTRK